MSVEDETWDKPIRMKIPNPNPISPAHRKIYKQMDEELTKKNKMKNKSKHKIPKQKSIKLTVDNYDHLKNLDTEIYSKIGLNDKTIEPKLNKEILDYLHNDYINDGGDGYLDDLPAYYIQKCGIDVARCVFLHSDYEISKKIIDEIQSSIYFKGWIIPKLENDNTDEEDEEDSDEIPF